MPVKITETITRDCCDPVKDLKPYRGIVPGGPTAAAREKLRFCKECGQIFGWTRKMGPAGSSEDEPVKVEPKL